MSSGYLTPTVLWHLMEEGTATLNELVALTGCLRPSLCMAVHRMRKLEQVQIAEVQSNGQYRFGLTRFGAETALRVERSAVEFATVQEQEVAS